ncbi:MAG: glycosyltransferase [Sedimentisphaerales bacterium]|nr:glycosyltransferase [Sedimentisphaerales bacterium]
MDSVKVNINGDGVQDTAVVAEGAELRVVLLADDSALHSYGPVLRRLGVGLIDEVSDLSLLCLESSVLLRHVPSPPVRIITESRSYQQVIQKYDVTSRRITVTAPTWSFVDRLRPRLRVERLAEALEKVRPTLIHAISEKQALLAQALSERLGIVYVVSMLETEGLAGVLDDRRCVGVFCSDSSTARRLREGEGGGQHGERYADVRERAERVKLLPIGTHVSKDVCCFNDEGRSPNIFCCCDLEYDRGLTGLVNSVKLLEQAGQEVHLLLSGEGAAERDLRRQAKQLGIESRVHFVPPIDKMVAVSDSYKAAFQEADIFVQPWPARKWRPELLESMSVGNAVVAVAGRRKDLVIDGKTALVVPFQDEKALVEALEKLCRDREYARRLGKSSQQYLHKHFLAGQMIRRLARFYREALSRKPE